MKIENATLIGAGHSIRTFICSAGSLIPGVAGAETWFAVCGQTSDRPATEAIAQHKLYDHTYTAKNLRAYVHGNTRNGNTTIALRADGADVLTITVPAGQTGQFENTSTQVTLQAGSLISFRAIAGGSSGSCMLANLQIDVVST